MSHECVSVERIAEVLELPAGNALRRHVEQCPRCSSLLTSYQAFIVADSPAGADLDDADARLTRFLQGQFRPAEPTPYSADTTPGDDGFFARLKGAFFPRPAWVAAAVLVVAAVVWWQPWNVAEPPALRSTSSTSFLEMAPPQTLSRGVVRLSWEATASADEYQVVLYNQELEEIARLAAGPETTYDVARDALPAGAPAVLICRIAALQEGDEIAESAPIPLEIP